MLSSTGSGTGFPYFYGWSFSPTPTDFFIFSRPDPAWTTVITRSYQWTVLAA
jgi:hypothetical protein